MTKTRHVVFGPPGTGKTTFLLSEMTRLLASGIPAERIGFVSFTRRAIHEAKARAAEVTSAQLPFVRTIHSLAYQQLGLSRGEVVTGTHLQEFANLAGVPFAGLTVDQTLWEGAMGDKCLGLHALARARGTSLEVQWRRYPELDLPWRLVRHTVAYYEQYKAANQVLDFDDMVERAAGSLDVDVLFVDEAQDTSSAQWAFLRRTASHVKTVYFAGDDDQAVYAWSGADATQLLRFRGDRRTLPISYRLPRKIKQLADRISRQISTRAPKTFAPRDADGSIQWRSDPEEIDLHGTESWLLLARSNYQLARYRQMAQQQGVVFNLPDGSWSWTLPAVRAAFTWEHLRKDRPISRAQLRVLNSYLPHRLEAPRHDNIKWADLFTGDGDRARTRPWMDALTGLPLRDREYIRALRRSGEKLDAPGRVRIGTVHSVKGAQADHVVLLTDLSERVAEGARIDPDAEHRVQYVGVTRARQSLSLVFPTSTNFWNF